MRSAWTIVALALMTPAAAQEVRPSFDCTKARSTAEKLVCSDAKLSQLDLDLAQAYKDALQKGKVEREEQREWIKSRDAACHSPDAKECLRASIERRIAELRQPMAGYSVSGEWPTGIHESTFSLDPKNAPICRALAEAANQSSLPKPMMPYHEPALEGAGIAEARWQPVRVDNPLSLIKALYRADKRPPGRASRIFFENASGNPVPGRGTWFCKRSGTAAAARSQATRELISLPVNHDGKATAISRRD